MDVSPGVAAKTLYLHQLFPRLSAQRDYEAAYPQNQFFGHCGNGRENGPARIEDCRIPGDAGSANAGTLENENGPDHFRPFATYGSTAWPAGEPNGGGKRNRCRRRRYRSWNWNHANSLPQPIENIVPGISAARPIKEKEALHR